jgi:hypothetical protein
MGESTMPDPRDQLRSRPQWPFAVATGALFLGFGAVWALSWLLFGLGTCGEDSEISAVDYARLCEPGGRIARNLAIIAGAALAATLGLAAAAVRRRAARPVLMLAAALTLAGAASLAADRL